MTPERKAEWDARVKELYAIRLGVLLEIYHRLMVERRLVSLKNPRMTKAQITAEILAMEFPTYHPKTTQTNIRNQY